VVHAKRSDAVAYLDDDELDQVGGSRWVLSILSIILLLAGVAMVVLEWFQ
jgi:hypothetical protein